jgi:co-chaperonin GroES (HSP10)
MNYPQPVFDCLLVKVESEKITKIKGKELELELAGTDGSEDTSKAAQTIGLVVSTPRRLYRGSKIVPEVKEGDTVFMHFHAITEDSEVDLGELGLYYLVPYELVFATVKDGKPDKMIGGRVLCMPVTDDADAVLDDDGRLVKKTKSGIIYEINIKPSTKWAKLAHIGTPLTGAPNCSVNPNDSVIYAVDADFEVTICDVKFFCMIQEDLLMYEPK